MGVKYTVDESNLEKTAAEEDRIKDDEELEEQLEKSAKKSSVTVTGALFPVGVSLGVDRK
jgi:hypothetical protein